MSYVCSGLEQETGVAGFRRFNTELITQHLRLEVVLLGGIEPAIIPGGIRATSIVYRSKARATRLLAPRARVWVRPALLGTDGLPSAT